MSHPRVHVRSLLLFSFYFQCAYVCRPSQKISVIRDFVCESLAGSSCVFHACAYATHDPDTIVYTATCHAAVSISS